uniref:Uncharacterized protein n=1 Tax=Arcella intermedia TaxID=1963864 RepID=A0A6B2LPC5_9EUKA
MVFLSFFNIRLLLSRREAVPPPHVSDYIYIFESRVSCFQPGSFTPSEENGGSCWLLGSIRVLSGDDFSSSGDECLGTIQILLLLHRSLFLITRTTTVEIFFFGPLGWFCRYLFL